MYNIIVHQSTGWAEQWKHLICVIYVIYVYAYVYQILNIQNKNWIIYLKTWRYSYINIQGLNKIMETPVI